jgi:hypothetical protein
MQAKFGSLQRQTESEDELMGASALQRQASLDEDELMGASALQRQASLDEDELMGASALQRQASLDEDELMGASTLQRQASLDEDELMGASTLQRQGSLDEDELMQQKAAPVQRQENNTGMPDQLKSGIENLSGFAMDDVNVHYNSPEPAQLNALAYTQGTDIHVAPGQEKHLPHEAWHVAQQKQGRVQPTMQTKGVAINDDQALEREADRMGAKALQTKRVR